jgi:hypothetical protein
MIRKFLKCNVSLLILPIMFFVLSFSQGCQTVPAKVQGEEKQSVVKKSAVIKESAVKESAVKENDLENAEYSSLSMYKGKVKLSRGLYRAKAAKGSATETIVALTNHIAFGKSANREGSAAILVTNIGGSGFFYDLAFMVKEKGKQRNIATTALGDRVKIKSLSIENGNIIVHMVKHNKKHPICCPTRDVTQKYTLKDNKLVQVSGK